MACGKRESNQENRRRENGQEMEGNVDEEAKDSKETAGKEMGCNPNTPVREKVRRIHLKEASLKQDESREMRPKGKRQETKMKQPTLASFMSARSGLEGPQSYQEAQSITCSLKPR